MRKKKVPKLAFYTYQKGGGVLELEALKNDLALMQFHPTQYNYRWTPCPYDLIVPSFFSYLSVKCEYLGPCTCIVRYSCGVHTSKGDGTTYSWPGPPPLRPTSVSLIRPRFLVAVVSS